eukprot:364976-Chlamydomonas_euryale.AAC.3
MSATNMHSCTPGWVCSSGKLLLHKRCARAQQLGVHVAASLIPRVELALGPALGPATCEYDRIAQLVNLTVERLAQHAVSAALVIHALPGHQDATDTTP